MSSAFIATMSGALVLVFLGVDWVVVDWDSDNMRLHDDWVWNLHWNVDWERHFDFLDDWDLDLLVHWILLDVVMVNSVDVVWSRDLVVAAGRRKKSVSIK
jgi:hypothetical protein